MIKDRSLADVVTEGIWSDNENSVRSTHLSNGYIVSTVKRSGFVKKLDEIINGVMGIAGITVEELAEHGQGFRADLSIEGEYETMVFTCDEVGEVSDWDEKAYCRYMSHEEAEEGHKEMVSRWRRVPSPGRIS